MKKIMRRALAAGLSLVLAAGLLSGCSGSAADPIQAVMGADSGLTSKTVMFTVDGNDVTAEDLFFWLAQGADYVVSYSSALGQEEPDWTMETMEDGESKTLNDYVKDGAKERAVLYSVMEGKAKEYGFDFTSEDKTAYEEELAQAKEDLGGEDAYLDWLARNCLSQAGMEKLSSVGVLYQHMLDGLFRDGGKYAPTAEELSTYAVENDYLAAKHILLLSRDMTTGAALSEDEVAAKKAQAEDILAQLRAITDQKELEKTFDKLMNQYSEDTELESNPDGYTFTAGQMISEFEDATRALEFGQVSDIVESDYGYHIILRLDPVASDSLRSTWAGDRLDELVDQWVDEAEIVDTDAFTNLDIADFYTKLTAKRDSLDAASGEAPDAEEAGNETTEDGDVSEGEVQAGTETEEAPE